MTALNRLLRDNLRNYGMFIALAAVIIFFSIWSKGSFITPYNLTNLINQTGTVGVMTAGMTMVIIIRHIDLSVGYLCGFMGAVAANLMMRAAVPVPAVLTILIVLAFGAAIGLGVGLLIGKVGIPAFVVTLAGMFIFRGLMLLATSASGTINITNDFFIAIGNGFVPSLGHIGPFELTTVLIGIAGIVLVILLQLRARSTQRKYRFEVSPMWVFVLKIALMSVLIAFVAYLLALERGISWTLVILGAVIIIFSLVLNRTRFGRHVYGVGGNPEAAELSGVSVVKVTASVFVIMGVLTALAGVLFASRMQSASPAAGTGFELLVIAGAFIGGCSAAGGVGKVTGSLIGALLMQSLVNGMAMMQVNISYQYVIQGSILLVAVLFDVMGRKARVTKRAIAEINLEAKVDSQK